MLTLTSDFRSPYPAAMRGVVHAETTDATVVDVTHDLPRQDVRAGAFWLRELLPWFPPAVHCAVVDPGVGTDRDALVVVAGDHVLVGPDNGLLAPVARELAGEATPAWYRLVAPEPETATFHGRDVFAPAAARVHETGHDPLETGAGWLEPAPDPVDLRFPTPTREAGEIVGEVLVVDAFGNVVTNVPGESLDGHREATVTVDGEPVPVRHSYAGVEPGGRLVTVGSHGNVELAVNRGRGDDAFGLGPGDTVRLGVGPGPDHG